MKTISVSDEFYKISDYSERSIAVYNDKMMGVKVKFNCSTTVPDMHKHHHQQLTYVISGSFKFWIGDTEVDLSEGNVVLIEPNIEHGCICVSEGGLLLDTFTPMREDFIEK